MKEFFFGCGSGSALKALRILGSEYPLNVMINYAGFGKAPKNKTKLFVDSGGFSFFFKKQEYNTPHKHYLDFVLKKNADLFANRDYPCEPELLKKNHSSVKTNQEKTIKNQIEIMELLENDYSCLKNKFVAVVQGWKTSEYLEMIDTMKEQGLLTKRIGIGSVCRRGRIKEIKEIILSLRESLPKKYGFHAFGVKTSVLFYKEIWEALISSDSIAFNLEYMYTTPRVKNAYLRILKVLLEWVMKLEMFEEKHKNQMDLNYWNKKEGGSG